MKPRRSNIPGPFVAVAKKLIIAAQNGPSNSDPEFGYAGYASRCWICWKRRVARFSLSDPREIEKAALGRAIDVGQITRRSKPRGSIILLIVQSGIRAGVRRRLPSRSQAAT
jgi:hypothetical protein